MLDIQRTLKDKLAANNIGEVLQTLKKIFEHNNDAYDEVISLQNRNKRLNITQRKGILSFEEETRLLNNLIANISSIINDISSKEEAAYELENAIYTKILIVSKTEDRSKAMKQLFSETYYKEVSYTVPKALIPIAELQPYEIIIFDNMETDEAYFKHYTHYLKQAQPYMLYFGQGRVDDSNGEKQKAYFTNSVFSLHARLNEMITYLKYKVD